MLVYSETFIELLAGYSRYHQNRTNKLLHAIGIPLLITSYIYGLSTPLFRFGMDVAGLPLSLAVLAYVLNGIYWIALGRRLAIFLIMLFFPVVWLSPSWTDNVAAHGDFWGVPANLIAFCLLNGAAWGFQLTGHFFEKKKPTFLNNMRQAQMAPLFLVFELGVLLGGCKTLASRIEQALNSSSPNS